ncbi:S-adenosyl-L-methionine-dependent methyltransferase [Xylona heveae TC161]|uniref:S-adenosyl-L-methionine-dependent methyltransferase n=1 Tax=Xylona heveae (strain CBS 132557 / TC161) TaxID=1328760 RepID=A0A165GVG7_XYLHT|nr:S-adenosyl-L-methionine-dependent methyltransferase [Xylona heveae TC161]KZF22646.1 S-adenosyl-L-methionine-dependent methyltransferase [Xylona heveae TC161]
MAPKYNTLTCDRLQKRGLLQAHLNHTDATACIRSHMILHLSRNYMDTDWLIDGGFLPEFVIRLGIRRQLRDRIECLKSASTAEQYARKMDYIDQSRNNQIAIHTHKANTQHYEVDAGVLAACLGPRMKYSCCLYPTGAESLGEAESAMLDSYIHKADLRNGQKILDLGCGWGSAALYFAHKFPNAHVVALSNSKSQKEFIEQKALNAGLTNLKVLTADVAIYELERNYFDRIISIELFEHMKNYESLLQKLSGALTVGGKLFVHLFCHKNTPYDFEDGWMSQNFFTGGTMPSADLLLYFQKDLTLRHQWWISGTHYARTCEDWLSKLCRNRVDVWPHLVSTYGSENALVWYRRWQVFYMACAELFAFDGGETWGVSHYLFEKTK